jgi:hypothetical protein
MAAQLPSSSLGSISRWYNAKKASGKSVQPWELQAAYRGELGNMSGQRNASRSLTLQQSRDEKTLEQQKLRDAEIARMNSVNAALAKERMAEQAKLQKDAILASAEAQEKGLLSQAEQAELNRKQQKQQFEDNQALIKEKNRIDEERAVRMEARQKEIDAYEKDVYKRKTEDEKARYDANLASQAEDRKAMQQSQMSGSLMGAGVMLGGAAIGKDGLKLGSWFSGTDAPEQLSGPGSKGYTYTPEGNAGGADGVVTGEPGWKLPEDAPNDFTIGEGNAGINLNESYTPEFGTSLESPMSSAGYELGGAEEWTMPALEPFDYSSFGGDLDYGGFDYSSLGGDNGFDYSSFGGDYAGLGGDIDWGSFGSDIDWGAIDFSGLF